MADEQWLSGDEGGLGGTSSGAKRVAVGDTKKEEKKRELNHLIVSAQTAQSTRQQSALAWWAVILPREALEPALRVVKQHAKATKGQSGHNKGSPHIQAWRMTVKTLIAMLEEKGLDKVQLDILRAHLTNLEKAGTALGHHYCRQCRVRELKDQKVMLLNYGLSSLIEPTEAYAVEKALHEGFRLLAGEVKAGTAPPSVAEKKLQVDIDVLKKQLGVSTGRREE